MKFSTIKPFIRFARFQELTEERFLLPAVPRDHRLFYVLEGEAQIALEHQAVSLSRGDLVIIRSGTVYRHVNKDVKYIAFNFDYTDEFSGLIAPIVPTAPSGAQTAPQLENIVFEDEKIFNDTLVVKGCFDLQKKLIELVEICQSALSHCHLQAGALFTHVLVELVHKTEEGNVSKPFDHILQYVREHCAEPITNATIGELFYYHPNYISAKFKSYTGKSLHSYILDCRIAKAVQLMEEGERELSIIADAVGFSDYNYFSRYFKKTIGITPKRYILSVRQGV